MARPASRLRRIARAIGRTGLGLFCFVMLVLVALFLAGRSNRGRQQILSIVLPAVEKSLAGKLRIGALDGDFTHMLVLRDVQLDDAEGQLAVRLPYVGLRYNLAALLGRTLHVHAVDLKRAEVHARLLKDGRLNLAALTRADDSPPSTGPLPIRILVSGIDADVAVDFAGGKEQGALAKAAAKVRLRGGLHLRPDRELSVDVDELGIDASDPLNARIALRGKLAMSLLDVMKSFAAKNVALSLASDGGEVTRVVPSAGLRGPLSLETKLDGSLAALAAHVRLSLPKGHAQLQANLNLIDDKLPWQIELLLEALDPSALRAGMPQSQIDLALRGKGSGTSGHLELKNLSVQTAKNGLRLHGDVAVPAVPTLLADPLAAEGGLSLRIDAKDLSELAQLDIGLPAFGGSLSGTVDVSIKQRRLGFSTHLAGGGLRGFGTALSSLRLDVDTTELAGQAKLTVNDLAVAGQKLAHFTFTAGGDRKLVRLGLDGEGPEAVKLKLGLRVQPQISGGSGPLALTGAQLTGIIADLDELQLRRADAQLSLTEPAHLELAQLTQSPVAEVKALALALGELRLRISGRYETQGRRLRATIDANQINVKELLQLASPSATVPASQLALHIEAGGTIESPSGTVRLSGHIDSLPGLLPWRVTPELTATLGERRVRGDLTLSTEATPAESGSPSVKAHFEAPLGTMGSIALTLDAETALEALRPYLPPTLQDLEGAAVAQVIVGGTLQQPQAEIKLTLPRWQHAPFRGTETTLNITYQQRQLVTRFSSQILSLSGEPLARAQLDSQVPLRLGLDVNSSQILDQLRSGAGTVDLAVHELALPSLLGAISGPTQKSLLAAGSGELAVQVRGPLLQPTMAVRFDAKGVRGSAGGPPLQETPLGAGLRISYAQDALGLSLNLDLDGKPLLHGQAGTKLSMAELVREGGALVDRLPIHAEVDLLPVPLPKGLPVRGTVKAHAEVSGTPRLPQLNADLSATNFLLGDWAVGELTLHAALDARRRLTAHAQIEQKQGSTGSLLLDAAVPLPFQPTDPALKLKLLASHFVINYQAAKAERASVRVVKGTLDSDLTVTGAKPQPIVLGSLALHEGQISTEALPQLVRDIVVDLRARPDGSIRLEQMSARAADGQITAEGGVQLSAGTLRSVELTSIIRNFPIAAGALGLWLDTKVVVAGRAQDDTLRVDVKIPYGTLRLPKLSSGSDSDVQATGPLEDVRYIDSAARAAAEKAEAEADAEAEQHRAAAEKGESGPPPLLPPRTLVSVDLPPAFNVAGPEVKTNIQGNLVAELGAQHVAGPSLTGEIRTLGGWVEILSRRYQLERAQVSLSGEAPPNPLLNVVLSRKLDDTTIYIQVGGSARKPVITFRSDPSRYDQAQVIGMVLSGSRGGTIQQQALGALSGLLVGKLKDSLGKAVPVDVIKLDVGGNDPSGANQSSLEVGKYLRDNLYLSYTHRFGSPSTILRRLNNDQVGLEYYFLPDYQINLMAGDQGVGALNLYWTKRY